MTRNMAKLSVIKNLLSLRCNRQTYSAIARDGVMKKKATETTIEKKKKEEEFWMKDPETGNWIPETHFGEVDIVELRRKFISKNGNQN
ncbi:unnamed protein product [Amaranthus hypochondriacus]